MDNNKLYAYLLSLLAIIVVVLSSIIFYYNIRQSEMMLLLIDKGINPAVIKCTEVSWKLTSNYVICKEILDNAGLSKKEAIKLIEELK